MSPERQEPKGIKIKSVLNPPDKVIELGRQNVVTEVDVGYTVNMSDGKKGEWIVTLTRGSFNDLFRMLTSTGLVNVVEFVFDEPSKLKSSDSEIPVFLEGEGTE